MMRSFKSKYWAIGLLLVLLVIGGAYYFAPYESSWLQASSVLDEVRMSQLIGDNATSLRKEKEIDVIQKKIKIKFVKPFRSPELAIIDFDTEKVCGVSGCLYAIYETLRPKVPIFRWLLRKEELPPNEPLFKVSGNCLLVNQSKGQEISQVHFCYSGRNYTQSKQLNFPKSH
jgi:hypothetical protein